MVKAVADMVVTYTAQARAIDRIISAGQRPGAPT
jgi:hypothetical protein